MNKQSKDAPTILVTDSGIGGLPVLSELAKSVEHARFVYYSDEKNVPYGNKSKARIEKFCDERIRIALNRQVDLTVVACNTMAIVGSERFKTSEIPTVFVDAAAEIDEKIALPAVLFCTVATSESERIRRLSTISGVKIYPLAHLAEDIERAVLNLEGLKSDELEKALAVASKYKTVVLGCTHYSLVAERFKKLSCGATIIDGCGKAVENALAVLTESGVLYKTKQSKATIGRKNAEGGLRFTFIGSGSEKAADAFFKLYGAKS